MLILGDCLSPNIFLQISNLPRNRKSCKILHTTHYKIFTVEIKNNVYIKFSDKNQLIFYGEY